MITVENALLKIEEIVNYGAQQRTYDFIKINDAYGRILAEDVISFYDVPAFRVSAKHGYAVLTSDGIGKRIVLSKATVSCDVKKSLCTTELSKNFFAVRSGISHTWDMHVCEDRRANS